MAAINYVAVIVTAIVSNIIGFIWYAPSVFGTKWMKLSGITRKDMKKQEKTRSRSMFWNAIATLVMAYVLSIFIKQLLNITTAFEGAQVGFWIWLGFIATVILGDVLWQGKPVKLYYLNAAHWLVSMLVMGAIIGAWN